MQLCMFHPADKPMERGWVGRLDGDRVIHLAAQTLQHFFTGGSASREHDIYPRDGVTLLVPVLFPPAVRVFEQDGSFAFANPAAIVGPEANLEVPGEGTVELHVRLAAVIGQEGLLGGHGLFVEVRTAGGRAPKDRDFGSVFGPFVVTPDEIVLPEVSLRAGGAEVWSGVLPSVDWETVRTAAAAGTTLRTGDLLVSPASAIVDGGRGRRYELASSGLGSLAFELR